MIKLTTYERLFEITQFRGKQRNHILASSFYSFLKMTFGQKKRFDYVHDTDRNNFFKALNFLTKKSKNIKCREITIFFFGFFGFFDAKSCKKDTICKQTKIFYFTYLICVMSFLMNDNCHFTLNLVCVMLGSTRNANKKLN